MEKEKNKNPQVFKLNESKISKYQRYFWILKLIVCMNLHVMNQNIFGGTVSPSIMIK